MLDDLSTGFVELKKDEVLETVKARIAAGEQTLNILADARLAMTAVGDQFQQGILFLAEMMLAAEIFKQVVAIHPADCGCISLRRNPVFVPSRHVLG